MRYPDNLRIIKPSGLKKATFSSIKHSGVESLVSLSSRHRRVPIAIGLCALLVVLSLSPAVSRKLTPGGVVNALDESISTFAGSDCTTPKVEWNLGQVACATASGATDERRIAWIAPNGIIAQLSTTFTGTSSDSYNIPTGTHPFAQVGTWRVETIDNNGVGFASTEFVVRDPGNTRVDLSVGNFGPIEVSPGSNLNYRVQVTNNGPDDALNVVLTDSVPANTTFVSEAQESGPSFECTTPSGAGGSISCTIANLPARSTAVFSIAFSVGATLDNGTIITNLVTVSSGTAELHSPDNSSSSSAVVTVGATTCTLNCGANITHDNDPDQCGAVVSYPTVTTSGNCGSPIENPVVCSPPSGSFFPIGTTAVTCSTLSGGTCGFSITVNDTRPAVQPTILCPANVSASEDAPGSGSAAVSYAAPATTGNCVTTTCVPASGSRFNVGTTVVECTATDSANNTLTCSFNVTVNSGAECVISCPSDIIQSASGSECTGIVNYGAPTTTGNCGTVNCSPPSGSTFPMGTTMVVCTSTQGPSCDFAVTILAAAAPTITTCATNKTVVITNNCEAAIPNLVGEVVATGCNATISQSPAAGTMVGAGTYTVTLTAENSSGEATCTATVTVHSLSEDFTGFFSPVGNPPVVNVVNAGRAVPVKFSLNGDKGLSIFAAGYPQSGEVSCNSSDPPVEVIETLTAGNSSLSYDAGTDRYTYVWATDTSWAGTCRQLIVKFSDGCVRVANFQFR